jgi:hypothetical protein
MTCAGRAWETPGAFEREGPRVPDVSLDTTPRAYPPNAGGTPLFMQTSCPERQNRGRAVKWQVVDCTSLAPVERRVRAAVRELAADVPLITCSINLWLKSRRATLLTSTADTGAHREFEGAGGQCRGGYPDSTARRKIWESERGGALVKTLLRTVPEPHARSR